MVDHLEMKHLISSLERSALSKRPVKISLVCRSLSSGGLLPANIQKIRLISNEK